MDPEFQETFNVMKGSVPARTDVPDTNFDACGKKAIADVKEATAKGTLMGRMAHGHAAPRGGQGCGLRRGDRRSSTATKSSTDAAKKLAQAVANAK